MRTDTIIKITFKNGQSSAEWKTSKEEWDDYAYDGKLFVIKKDHEWVGLYNMDSVISVVIRRENY